MAVFNDANGLSSFVLDDALDDDVWLFLGAVQSTVAASQQPEWLLVDDLPDDDPYVVSFLQGVLVDAIDEFAPNLEFADDQQNDDYPFIDQPPGDDALPDAPPDWLLFDESIDDDWIDWVVGQSLADEAANAGGPANAFLFDDDLLDDGDFVSTLLAQVVADNVIEQAQQAAAGGYGNRRRKWRVLIGDKVHSLTQDELVGYKAELEQVIETAQARPQAKPAQVARTAVRIVERPAEIDYSESQAFAKFIAKLREDYASALRTQLIIRAMQDRENDDEEALMLLL